jgi:hypothetical protein
MGTKHSELPNWASTKYSSGRMPGARTFLNGALGSTVALTDSMCTMQMSYTFDPFGAKLLPSAAADV